MNTDVRCFCIKRETYSIQITQVWDCFHVQLQYCAHSEFSHEPNRVCISSSKHESSVDFSPDLMAGDSCATTSKTVHAGDVPFFYDSHLCFSCHVSKILHLSESHRWVGQSTHMQTNTGDRNCTLKTMWLLLWFPKPRVPNRQATFLWMSTEQFEKSIYCISYLSDLKYCLLNKGCSHSSKMVPPP